jgi:hypothetical protein
MKDYIRFKPLHIFESASRAMRIYTEWLSGNAAWSMQVSFFVGLSPFHPGPYIPVESITRWCNSTWGHPIV